MDIPINSKPNELLDNKAPTNINSNNISETKIKPNLKLIQFTELL